MWQPLCKVYDTPRQRVQSKEPMRSQNENKNYLPVFWQHNQKAWVRAIFFLEWFHQCFILKEKKYLEEEGIIILLITVPVPGHPESVYNENENVEVAF